MDEFKIIFYVAVAIAWVVYKNYQKVNQNRPKKTGAEKTSPAKNIFEELQEKIKDEKTKRQQQHIPKTTEIKKTAVRQTAVGKKTAAQGKFKSSPTSFTSVADPPFGIPTEKQAAENRDGAEESKKEITEDVIFDIKKMDIRTAIIYSVILKRPQF